MSRVLRILHVASGDLWAGAEVQAFTLMSHLAQMPRTEVGAVVLNEGILADRLRSVGVSVCVLDELKIAPLRIFIQLRSVLRGWKPDVIHTHRQKENILGSLANRSCRDVPSVRTVHGASEHARTAGWAGVRQRMVAGVDRWCGHALQQKVIAVTQELGARLMVEFPREKVAVIENGVDVEQVRRDRGAAEFRKSEPDVTHIGIAGRLVQVKRVDLFMETAALLLREHPERIWRFHIFGDGPMRLELRALSRSLQLGERVLFHGHRQDIATCVGGLDALVICSDHEGMPMISLEAAALDVPTVAHAVGGLVEVVPREFLVVRHDSCGYRDGILCAVREDGRDIAAKGARRILERFSAQRNAERIRELYEQLVEERSGNGAGK